jgi:hypothetical protein
MATHFLDLILQLRIVAGRRRRMHLTLDTRLTELGWGVLDYLGAMSNAASLQAQIADTEVPTVAMDRRRRERLPAMAMALQPIFGPRAVRYLKSTRRYLKLLFWLKYQDGVCRWVGAEHMRPLFHVRDNYDARVRLRRLANLGLVAGPAIAGGHGLWLTRGGTEALEILSDQLPDGFLGPLLHESHLLVDNHYHGAHSPRPENRSRYRLMPRRTEQMRRLVKSR